MKLRFFSLIVVALAMSLSALAESATDIRHRMEQRLPKIDALKSQEAVGETNRGFLEARKVDVPDAAAVVADENRDREAVYVLIAKQTGSAADAVGRARAKQIAAGSRPGVWVEDESGQWHKK
jgi:uncharacterized protein YdbL (DUF1318 family)